MMRSKFGKITQVFGYAKTLGSGDSTSAVIDLQGFKSCMLSFAMGVFNFTSTNKATLTLLDSSDNTTYGTVAFSDCEGLESAAVFKVWDASASEASSVIGIHYRGVKRYLKAVVAEGGTISVAGSCVAVLQDQDMSPSID